jgi:hypothetical protein
VKEIFYLIFWRKRSSPSIVGGRDRLPASICGRDIVSPELSVEEIVFLIFQWKRSLTSYTVLEGKKIVLIRPPQQLIDEIF